MHGNIIRVKNWYFTKPMVQDPKEELHKFIFSGNNDEVVKFILFYISREIHSNIRIINYLNYIWKNLLDKIDDN